MGESMGNDPIVAEFRANGGLVRTRGFGRALVLLHTRGARTGQERVNPVRAIRDGDGWLIIASAGGDPAHPAWYFNLLAHPEVSLQDGPVVRALTAREVHGDEKQVWWNRAITVFDKFDEYQAMTLRSIPLLVLESRTA
jgi:deazaflavin-dependent oxidoreductase (nitroreductase family)